MTGLPESVGLHPGGGAPQRPMPVRIAPTIPADKLLKTILLKSNSTTHRLEGRHKYQATRREKLFSPMRPRPRPSIKTVMPPSGTELPVAAAALPK